MVKFALTSISLLFFLEAPLALAKSVVTVATPGPEYPVQNIEEMCPDRLQGFENIQIQQTLSGDGKRCYFGVHPRDAFETLIYRDYLLRDDGLFMVFNSFSDGKSEATDGAREFYFLPSQFKGFQWKVEASFLVVTGFVGQTLKFSLKTAQLESLSGAEIKLADQVVPENKGGLEIVAADYMYVDAGFRLGDSPSYDRARSSEIKNSQHQVCKLRNAKTYNYLDDTVYLKPFSELKSAIQSSCVGFGLD